jgi:hypothetical protein
MTAITDHQRLALCAETVAAAKLAAELRLCGRAFEADRVAENAERLARN